MLYFQDKNKYKRKTTAKSLQHTQFLVFISSEAATVRPYTFQIPTAAYLVFVIKKMNSKKSTLLGMW